MFKEDEQTGHSSTRLRPRLCSRLSSCRPLSRWSKWTQMLRWCLPSVTYLMATTIALEQLVCYRTKDLTPRCWTSFTPLAAQGMATRQEVQTSLTRTPQVTDLFMISRCVSAAAHLNLTPKALCLQWQRSSSKSLSLIKELRCQTQTGRSSKRKSRVALVSTCWRLRRILIFREGSLRYQSCLKTR